MLVEMREVLPDGALVGIGLDRPLDDRAGVLGDRLRDPLQPLLRRVRIADERGTWQLREAEEQKIHRAAGERPAEVVSPMPGSVIAVFFVSMIALP